MDLISSGGDDDGLAHCAHCGAIAAGPCARCGRPVCGDCCVLTEGGADLWAVCTSCDRRGGRSLRSGWVAALVWLVLPLVALVALIALLEWAFGRP